MVAHRIVVKGKVQGVFFRKSARQKAEELDIKGWVRNLPDDSVEIMAQGSDENLKKFIVWCRKGPPAAVVTEFMHEEKGVEFFTEFAVVK